MASIISNPKVQELLDRFLLAIRDEPVSYAVGGAVAMAVHGFARYTSDLDIFVLDESRSKLLRALRAAGFRVAPVAPPFHYFAMLPGEEDLEVHIDLLFPAGEPELSAVEHPSLFVTPGPLGQQFPVFPVELLVMAKFMSDRESDHSDVVRMYDRGLFEPVTVEALFASFDEEEARTFRQWIHGVVHRSRTPRRSLPRKTKKDT